MDDLLESIRKIITEEHGEARRTSGSADEESGREAEEERPAATAPGTEAAGAQRSDADMLPELVGRSLMGAFDLVDDEERPRRKEPESRAAPRMPSREEEMDTAVALQSIADAIARECMPGQPAKRTAATAEAREATAVWRSPILSEPGLDTAEAGEAGDMEDAGPAFGSAWDETVAPEAERPPEARREVEEPRRQGGRIAGLKARFEPRFNIPRGQPRAAAPEPSPAAPPGEAQQTAHQPAPGIDAAEPIEQPAPETAQPAHARVPAGDRRTVSQMTDTAMDRETDDAEGNVFRRAAPRARPEGREEGLTSDQTRSSVNMAFDQLSRTILSSNPRTLEDLVRDMMRPLLREWLEANLPEIVERQVRQEIERVSTRGRW